MQSPILGVPAVPGRHGGRALRGSAYRLHCSTKFRNGSTAAATIPHAFQPIQIYSKTAAITNSKCLPTVEGQHAQFSITFITRASFVIWGGLHQKINRTLVERSAESVGKRFFQNIGLCGVREILC